ncbi:SMI1/KNR4 family protein [Amycolatopsis sp. A133]|uniref:SMI1/KNR4 family protein n=1 Tax=Amycolatopsis sp. A133 TaxID=3064472 RepID=UPI0027FAE06A|nr:SMI1/KNR4 family protein [Amycolatopsis sp. A133]MDQ7809347.1 SMI1/KNR4 family protein [Amycolatopsis sp. A133]
MPPVLSETWQRIVALLEDLAPATARVIRPPASATEVHRLLSVLPAELPADLLEWWSAMDGVDDERDYRAGALVPHHFVPLAVHRVREEYLRQQPFLDSDCCTADHRHHKAAGEQVFPYCAALVPVCRSIDGGMLCVDTRPGGRFGCLMNWYADEGAYAAEWSSVTHLLTDVAGRLGGYRRSVDDEGMLDWNRDLA